MQNRESSKIVSLPRLVELRGRARAEGRRVVQCHGCFDIVHPGHVRHLRYARGLGDVLLVSITGDEQMRKGAGRPLIPEELRAENLAALDCVDWVHVNHSPTATALLEVVQPDVYVKGREYETNNDPAFRAEAEMVQRHGGRIVFSSGDVVFSSTALIGSMEASIDGLSLQLVELLRQPGLDGQSLLGLLAGFRDKRVVIIGEVIRDHYVFCDRPRVASESPVLTLRPLERRSYDGGAAIIAAHVAALGGMPTLVTGLPESGESEALRSRLAASGVRVLSVPVDTPIPVKERYVAGTQKVVKLDLFERIALDSRRQDRLIELARESSSDADAAILADFGIGLCTPVVIDRMCAALRPLVATLVGDVSGKESNLRAMRTMDLVTPSEEELRDALNCFDRSLPTVAWDLLEGTRSAAAIIKMGADGLVAFDRCLASGRNGRPKPGRLSADHVPALAAHAIDPLGAGDALLAASALSLAAGGSLLQAAFLGSAAAALESMRIGNVAIGASELRRYVTRLGSAHLEFVHDIRPISHRPEPLSLSA
jgi:rfaE bifunctional protein kinase chain/domain/rfaE bifunctional protein nucleotidyltransferase chain/domain